MKTESFSNKAALGWLGTLLVFWLIATGINHLTVNRKTHQRNYQIQATQPSPIINSVDFPDGVNRREFNLSPDSWIKVTLPLVKADIRISSPKGTIIKFWNGETVIDNGPDSPNWLPAKIDRSIFYMQNINGGKTTVMVTRK